ncbi:PQ-loop repeat [Trinorchestia longiramus]|nr:PQ-loop repeat [Trinorchestia longiramus]
MSLVIEPIIALANVSTILLSSFNKVPQIASVVKARSFAGLSIYSVLLELTGYCITMSYFISYQYALPSYLEYPFLVAQDVCLVAAALYFGSQLGGLPVLGYAGVLVSLMIAMVSGLLADSAMALLVSSTTPISAGSKVVQLLAIIRSRSSEGISLAAWLISSYCCCTRLLTVYVETGDPALLVNFGISLLLNLGIVAATLHYAPRAAAVQRPKKE